MKGFRGVSFLVLALVLALPLFAVCNINVGTTFVERGTRLTWDAAPGATQYYFEYSTDNFATTQRQILGPNARSVDFVRTSSGFLTHYAFRIIGFNDKDPNVETCTGNASINLIGNSGFRTAIGRAIVPVVASIPGLNGAQFKTSLRLRAVTANVGTGKIIFHPAGQTGSDADPSITYSFSRAGQTIEYDDIVGAFGRTGVGSLDIIPDLSLSNTGFYVPIAEARLYNQTSNGTFGSFEHQVQPIDFIDPIEARALAPPKGFRVNIGFRTVSTSIVNIDVFDANGDVRLHRSQIYPANFTLLTTPEDLLNTSIGPGESLSIAAERGSIVIPFYSYTDNGTNDPSLFVPELTVKAQVGPYDLPGIINIF